MDEKQFSETKKEITLNDVVIWNQHFFFEKEYIKRREFENAKVQITILQKRLLKNTMIGMYEFDLSSIYLKKHHTLFHAWAALSNIESTKFTNVTGYLKVSISVTGENDPAISLTEDTSYNREDNTNLMIPNYIEMKYY